MYFSQFWYIILIRTITELGDFMKKTLSLIAAGIICTSTIGYADSINSTFTRLGQFVSTLQTASPATPAPSVPTTKRVVLGNEQITNTYSYLIDGKKIGLVTNQTGVNADLVKTVDVLYNYQKNKSYQHLFSRAWA